MPGTELTAGDIAELAAGFGLGSVSGWRRVEAGTINSNYQLSADAGQYFLRVNEGKRDDDVDYEAALVGELASRGVPTPTPARCGEAAFARFGTKQVSLFPWIDGEHAGPRPSLERARAVGKALAGLHLAGLAIAARFERESRYSMPRIAERLSSLSAHAADPALAPTLPRLEREMAQVLADQRRTLPRGIIHGDLFVDNVLFARSAGDVVAVLDFEQASTGILVYDLAVAINAWSFAGVTLREDTARALVSGYQTLRALDDAERAALAGKLRAAALRFTITRITDVHLGGLAREGKDFREFAARLAHWQKAADADVQKLLADCKQ